MVFVAELKVVIAGEDKRAQVNVICVGPDYTVLDTVHRTGMDIIKS
jgi:hypothetical protein